MKSAGNAGERRRSLEAHHREIRPDRAQANQLRVNSGALAKASSTAPLPWRRKARWREREEDRSTYAGVAENRSERCSWGIIKRGSERRSEIITQAKGAAREPGQAAAAASRA